MHLKLPLLSKHGNFRLGFVFLMLLYACTLVGCRNAHHSKLVGDWGIEQPDAVLERIEATETLLDESDESRMVLRFLQNGRLETKTKMGSVDLEKQGSWKMVSFDPETNSMDISCEINMQTSEHTVTFVDENIIELVPPNMAGLTMKVKFKRL